MGDEDSTLDKLQEMHAIEYEIETIENRLLNEIINDFEYITGAIVELVDFRESEDVCKTTCTLEITRSHDIHPNIHQTTPVEEINELLKKHLENIKIRSSHHKHTWRSFEVIHKPVWEPLVEIEENENKIDII